MALNQFFHSVNTFWCSGLQVSLITSQPPLMWFVGPTPHRIVGQAPIAGDTGWFGPIDASGGRSGQQARIET